MKESELKARLARYRQIKVSVIGRKSGRTISIPVWFVLESDKLYLMPVQGSDTQWYKNVLKNPSIRIDALGVEAEFRAVPINEAKAVKSVVEKFREKYGEKDVKKYYSKFDVAVIVRSSQWGSAGVTEKTCPIKVALKRGALLPRGGSHEHRNDHSLCTGIEREHKSYRAVSTGLSRSANNHGFC